MERAGIPTNMLTTPQALSFPEDAQFYSLETIDLGGSEDSSSLLDGQICQVMWPFPCGTETQRSVVLKTLCVVLRMCGQAGDVSQAGWQPQGAGAILPRPALRALPVGSPRCCELTPPTHTHHFPLWIKSLLEAELGTVHLCPDSCVRAGLLNVQPGYVC